MKNIMKTVFVVSLFILSGLSFISSVQHVSAHEVYVLDRTEIAEAMAQPRPDFAATISNNNVQFIASVVVAGIMLIVVSLISFNLKLRKKAAPLLAKLKTAAPIIAQITLGVSIFASGFFGAAFGIELPLTEIFGHHTELVDEILMALGLLLVLGILPRIAALGVLVFFSIMIWKFGFYMFNYGIYFGEALAIVIFGAGYTLYKNKFLFSKFRLLLQSEKLHEYSFFMVRIFFGISLIFASLYAKFFYGAMALETVTKYNLTNYFPFEATFVVLGAMITEISIGLCILFGVYVRFVNVLFLGFLFSSLLFFGESVWPHLVLIGTAIAVLAHGYDSKTAMMKLTKEKSYEPVL